MSRSITIDAVETGQITLVRHPNGEIRVYAEYQLKAGSQVIQGKYVEVTDRLGLQGRLAAASLFSSIAQDVTTAELA